MFSIDLKLRIILVLKDLFFVSRYLLIAFICLLIPVKKNKIFISCFKGKSTGGNIKYIVKEIIAQNLDYELVWACEKEYIPKNEEWVKKIRFIDYNDKYKRLFETASAKIWLDDSLKTNDFRKGLIKKKNQVYINTWHGSFGIKKLFFDAPNSLSMAWGYLYFLDKDFNKYCDIMLTNCEWEEDVFRRAFRFNGKLARVGHPKNDIFFEDREFYKNKVYSELKIDKTKKIAFYMPSFRVSLLGHFYNIDYKNVELALSKRFGGSWVVVSRFHYMNTDSPNEIFGKKDNYIDATYYPDAQELLFAADALISDYSSCMFDFMLTKLPCFIYATDIDDYDQKRGFYYPLETTPFPIAKNNEEMVKNILNFDYEKFKKDSEEFLKPRNILEDGLASKRTVEIIKGIINRG